MRIIFNGRDEPCDQEETVGNFLVKKGYQNLQLMVLLNDRLFRPGEWDGQTVKPGDRLDVIHFVGGG